MNLDSVKWIRPNWLDKIGIYAAMVVVMSSGTISTITATPNGAPTVSDSGTPASHATLNGQGAQNGRMLSPQDQRQSPASPRQITCLPGESLHCAVEAATDAVNYTWHCLHGKFQESGIESAAGRAATYVAVAAGSETLTCTISDGRQTTDPRYEKPLVRQVEVTVPQVQILVRRCGSGNAFSDKCIIAAEACDSPEQKADVRIQLTPAIQGISVHIPVITGGGGVRRDPVDPGFPATDRAET